MKKVISCALVIMLLAGGHTKSQTTISMRAGYSFKTSDAYIAANTRFTIFNTIKLGPELLVNTKRDAPADFGITISHEYSFIEMGAGYYYELYSTDPQTSYKNNWTPGVFVSGHYKLFFIQYEYINQSKISIGLREYL